VCECQREPLLVEHGAPGGPGITQAALQRAGARAEAVGDLGQSGASVRQPGPDHATDVGEHVVAARERRQRGLRVPQRERRQRARRLGVRPLEVGAAQHEGVRVGVEREGRTEHRGPPRACRRRGVPQRHRHRRDLRPGGATGQREDRRERLGDRRSRRRDRGAIGVEVDHHAIAAATHPADGLVGGVEAEPLEPLHAQQGLAEGRGRQEQPDRQRRIRGDRRVEHGERQVGIAQQPRELVPHPADGGQRNPALHVGEHAGIEIVAGAGLARRHAAAGGGGDQERGLERRGGSLGPAGGRRWAIQDSNL
jgi:hypothetical protein